MRSQADYFLTVVRPPNSVIAESVFNLVWRCTFTAPGFCLLDIGPDFDSHTLRSWMVDLKHELSEKCLQRAGKKLLYRSMARFDQQETTKFHIDGAPAESMLMLGYEPSKVLLTLLVLKTRQVEQLRLFIQTLGIELKEEQHGKGPIHFAGRAGGTVIEVYPLRDKDTPVDASTRLGFAVENLTEVVQKLQSLGASVITPPKETPWGLRAVVRDPDGLAVELSQR
jgi:lactoylglutathione lyase